MALSINTTSGNAMLNLLVDAIDASSPTHGTIKLYTSPQPSKGVAITTQVLLSTHTLSLPCGSVSSGILTLDAIGDAIAVASGPAAWGRIANGAGTFVADFDIGLLTSTAFLKMASLMIYDGSTVSVQSGAIQI